MTITACKRGILTLTLSLLIIISTGLSGGSVKLNHAIAQHPTPLRIPLPLGTTNNLTQSGHSINSPREPATSYTSGTFGALTGESSSPQESVSTGDSQFSGTTDIEDVYYRYCKNPDTNENDECRITYIGHTDFQGTLDYFGRFPSGADVTLKWQQSGHNLTESDIVHSKEWLSENFK